MEFEKKILQKITFIKSRPISTETSSKNPTELNKNRSKCCAIRIPLCKTGNPSFPSFSTFSVFFYQSAVWSSDGLKEMLTLMLIEEDLAGAYWFATFVKTVWKWNKSSRLNTKSKSSWSCKFNKEIKKGRKQKIWSLIKLTEEGPTSKWYEKVWSYLKLSEQNTFLSNIHHFHLKSQVHLQISSEKY